MNWPIEDIEEQAAIIESAMTQQGLVVDPVAQKSIAMLLQAGNDGYYAGYSKGYDDGICAEKLHQAKKVSEV